MQIKEIIGFLESVAPPYYQESYDNCGLLTGNDSWECKGILCTLDTLEATVEEAKAKGCNLIISHHPILFSGIKKLNGKNYVERTVIAALKNDIAIYAIHTNLDNVYTGVSKKMCDILGLINTKILAPKAGELLQFSTYAPKAFAQQVMNVLFEHGAGHIGSYSECSFSYEGKGSFMPGEQSNPKIGEANKREYVDEIKVECLLPKHIPLAGIVEGLKKIGFYEEVAYNVIPLQNIHQEVGSGMIGETEKEIDEKDFLRLVKDKFRLSTIRHTALLNRKIKKVALCGGSGSFLLPTARKQKADVYITSDVKYHEFFDAEGEILLADIGHFESEQFTIELLFDILRTKFSTFAVLKTENCTNPVYYM